MIPKGSLRVYESAGHLQDAVAGLLVEVVLQAQEHRGTCLLVLSGGETPRPIYHRLGAPSLSRRVDWGRVHLLFGDERMVPPWGPQSNFGMVERELLSRIRIPPENVHRIKGEKGPADAAREYERDVRGLISDGRRRLDCVLLGLGEDGHTVSLFPGSSVLQERVALMRPVFRRRQGSWRVTMTLPLINAARRVVFVVAGEGKAGIMRRITRERKPTVRLPASLVQPVDGELVWMVDGGAASQL